MDLYKLHTNPKNIIGYREAHDKVPFLIWKKYLDNEVELRRRKHILAQDPKIAYFYAIKLLVHRFPSGESAIATSAHYSYHYALQVIKGRFPLGEPAIMKDLYRYRMYKLFII